MKKYFFTGYFASQFQNLRCEMFVDRTFVVATGVSNLFFFAYLLFILLEKNIPYPHFEALEQVDDTLQILHIF